MKGRINLGPDSTGAAEPRERVVSLWISLVRKKLLFQGIPIEETNINAENPGKMCKFCFANFQRFYKLQVQLEENLMVALRKMSFTHLPAENTYQTTNTTPTHSRSASIAPSHSRSTNIALSHSGSTRNARSHYESTSAALSRSGSTNTAWSHS